MHFQCLTIESQHKRSRHCSDATVSWRNVTSNTRATKVQVQKNCAATSAEHLGCWFHIYGLDFFFSPEFTGEEVLVQHLLSMSVFLASPVFQVFILLMVSLVGLSCGLALAFRELRRKNVVDCLTVKCTNNALPFCTQASSVNAYGRLLEKFSCAILVHFYYIQA